MAAALDPLQAPAIDWRGARRAVSLIFFLHGLVLGSWALHIPFLIERLEITEAAMGLVIAMLGAGALVAMALLGTVLPRTGSRRPAQLSVLATSLFVPALALTPDYPTTLAAAAIVLAFAGVTSVVMNAQGVAVERRARRTLMSSFHAF